MGVYRVESRTAGMQTSHSVCCEDERGSGGVPNNVHKWSRPQPLLGAVEERRRLR